LLGFNQATESELLLLGRHPVVHELVPENLDTGVVLHPEIANVVAIRGIDVLQTGETLLKIGGQDVPTFSIAERRIE
jgi:hypothetical protein